MCTRLAHGSCPSQSVVIVGQSVDLRPRPSELGKHLGGVFAETWGMPLGQALVGASTGESDWIARDSVGALRRVDVVVEQVGGDEVRVGSDVLKTEHLGHRNGMRVAKLEQLGRVEVNDMPAEHAVELVGVGDTRALRREPYVVDHLGPTDEIEEVAPVRCAVGEQDNPAVGCAARAAIRCRDAGLAELPDRWLEGVAAWITSS